MNLSVLKGYKTKRHTELPKCVHCSVSQRYRDIADKKPTHRSRSNPTVFIRDASDERIQTTTITTTDKIFTMSALVVS